jgi:lipid-binding SYLF domain-containing protein
MKRNLAHSGRYAVVLTVILFALASLTWGQSDTKDSDKGSSSSNSRIAGSDIAKRIDNAAKVLNEIMATPDSAIPDNVFADANCIAVIPSMVKIAVGFGGNHGKGVATCRTTHGWSALAPIDVTGGSWGLQIGGQAVDLVLLVMNQKGMDALLSSKFKVGGDASAAAGPVGRHAEASTDWKMKSEILSYSRARGVFAGIDLSGSVIKQDQDDTRLLYSKMVPFAEILSGKVPPASGSEAFLAAVKKYSTATNDKQGKSIPPGPAVPSATSADYESVAVKSIR